MTETLRPKGTEQDHNGISTLWESDELFSAQRRLLKRLEFIYIVGLGKPYVLPNTWVESP